jgi:hypothetical protein
MMAYSLHTLLLALLLARAASSVELAQVTCLLAALATATAPDHIPTTSNVQSQKPPNNTTTAGAVALCALAKDEHGNMREWARCEVRSSSHHRLCFACCYCHYSSDAAFQRWRERCLSWHVKQRHARCEHEHPEQWASSAAFPCRVLWFRYHLWLGVSHIYVFDHGSHPPLAVELEELVQAGQVGGHS